MSSRERTLIHILQCYACLELCEARFDLSKNSNEPKFPKGFKERYYKIQTRGCHNMHQYCQFFCRSVTSLEGDVICGPSASSGDGNKPDRQHTRCRFTSVVCNERKT